MYAGEPAGAPVTPLRRPPPVTAAATIMTVMGLVGLVHALVGLAMMDRVVDQIRAAGRGVNAPPADVASVVLIVRLGALVGAIVGLVFAVLLVVLALGNLRGSNAARVATWVVCGLGLVCGCAGLAATVSERAVSWNGPDDPARAALFRALGDAYPAWWIGLTAALSAAQALGYLVVALLLAVPGATAFFRREPSVGGSPSAPPAPVPPPM